MIETPETLNAAQPENASPMFSGVAHGEYVRIDDVMLIIADLRDASECYEECPKCKWSASPCHCCNEGDQFVPKYIDLSKDNCTTCRHDEHACLSCHGDYRNWEPKSRMELDKL